VRENGKLQPPVTVIRLRTESGILFMLRKWFGWFKVWFFTI